MGRMTMKSSQLHPSLRDMKLGVWRVILEKDPTRFSLMAPWQKFKIAFPTIRKLTLDCFALAPVLFPLLCLQMMFTQVVPTIMWHLLNRIISIFGIGLTRGQFDSVAISNAVVARIAFAVVVAVISYGSRQMEDIVQHRIVNHFEAISFEWKSRADKSTIEDCVKDEDNLTTTMVWYAYRDVLLAAGRAISILAQLYYISTLASTNKEASLYIILLFVKPVTRHIFEPSLWGKSWVAEAIEPNFTRMHSLKSVGGKAEYKQEMNGSLVEYLVQEYRKARRLLGDTSASYPAAQYRGGFGLVILSELLGHLYLFYFLSTAILHPSSLTLSKIVMLPKAGDMITDDFDSLMDDLRDTEKVLAHTARIYELVNAENKRRDGNLDLLTSTDRGMSLCMKNVAFSYPGSKSEENALHDVSFSIEAGQVVVIVGTNGSGKSTILKLLTRMYECTSGSGQILIEGQDIRDYKLDELRGATAMFTQDHHIFPLSLSENIGIGNPEQASNEHLIEESAKKGRADAFISKYAEKYNTVLDPMVVKLSDNVSEVEGDPLAQFQKELEKPAEISGGERQRVAASRAFMRLTSGRIKLLIADEPSSSLDPQGEFELFQNIMKERHGKTMIFVTHRFGPLTHHADLILCMKNGRLVEQGTHCDLMARRGEYFRLYDVQARTFNHSDDQHSKFQPNDQVTANLVKRKWSNREQCPGSMR